MNRSPVQEEGSVVFLMNMRIAAFLPVYNEADNLKELFEGFICTDRILSREGHILELIIVDDGSRDASPSIIKHFAATLRIHVITHDKNRGLHETIRTALRYAVSRNAFDILVTMDADNSHDPSIFPALIEKIKRGADVVIASRYIKGGKQIGLSMSRRFLSRVCTACFQLIYPLRFVTDYTTGYRAIRRSTLMCVAKKTSNKFFKARGFAAASELLIACARCTDRFDEIPLVLRYDKKKGRSKNNIKQAIISYVMLFLRLMKERGRYSPETRTP